MGLFKIILGDYPPEYKPEVHGPYDPGRYYGKPDTPLKQVKLRELPAWLKRRNYKPKAMAQVWFRFLWNSSHKYQLTKRFTGVHLMMVVAWVQVFYWVNNRCKQGPYIIAKYH